MWLLLLVPVLVIAGISVVGLLDRPPVIAGADPAALRTVVTWRDAEEVAVDVGADPHEQLRQLAGALAEERFIFSCSLERDRAAPTKASIATVDVRELRLEVRVRAYRGGWLLWVSHRGHAPADSDELRQLLTGLYRVLDDRRAEQVRWHRRESYTSAESAGAPTPFYVS